MRTASLCAAAGFAVFLAGCGGGPPRPPQHQEEEWHAPAQILLKYADKDGKLTRDELEAGLRRDFDLADKNHDGVLEPDEVRAVNEQRWEEDKSAISPLQDFNGDGMVDFDEFAGTARALFVEMDRNHDGVLTPEELKPGRGSGTQNEQQPPPHGHHGGRGGPGRGGPDQD